MPYLAFELDAKKNAQQVARAAGVEPGRIVWGLLEMWEQVWLRKSAVLPELVLDGCFGPSDRIRELLAAYNFIATAEGGWRVRGAERILGTKAARAKGGHAAKNNLVPGARQKKAAERLAENIAEKVLSAPSAAAESQPRASPEAAENPLSARLGSQVQHPAPSLKNPLAGDGAQKPAGQVPRNGNSAGTEPAFKGQTANRGACDPADLREGIERLFRAHTGRVFDWGFPNSPQERALRAVAALGPLDAVLSEVDAAFHPGGLVYTLEQIPSSRNAIAQKAAKLRHAAARAAAGTGPPTKGRATNADKDWNAQHPTTQSEHGEEWDFGAN